MGGRDRDASPRPERSAGRNGGTRRADGAAQHDRADAAHRQSAERNGLSKDCLATDGRRVIMDMRQDEECLMVANRRKATVKIKITSDTPPGDFEMTSPDLDIKKIK